MNVILYMAMAANGIIAGPHNEEDFLSHYNWEMLCTLARKYGNFIWGRKTYEIVNKWEPKYFTDDIKNARKIIVSSDTSLSLQDGYTQAHSAKEALRILKNEGFQTAILTGGSTLNSTFAKEGLIDEIQLNIEGVIVGKGIPLFHPQDFQLDLELSSIERFEQNGITLQYKVLK